MPGLTNQARWQIKMMVESPHHYNPGPYLFLDPWLIASQANLEPTIHWPRRGGQPSVTAGEDENFQPYVSVAHDPDTGIYRMWYNTPVNEKQSRLATLTSDNGLRWQRPHRILEDPSPIRFGASVLDEGADFKNPEERFKFAYWAKEASGKGGLHIAVSSDGLAWRPLRPGVILEHNHDICSLHWDPIREHYVAFVSVLKEGGNGWYGRRRIPHQSVSKDLVTWEEPWSIVEPVFGEKGETEFYGVDAMVRRGYLLIAFVKVLRDDLNAEFYHTAEDQGDDHRKAAGIGYTVLAWSRDGRNWERHTEPFLERNPRPGIWDRAIAWIDSQVIVGEDIHFYYGGYARGHKVSRFTERAIGHGHVRRDRYLFYHATPGPGVLRTRTGVLDGASMSVNCNIYGGHDVLRIRVLDENNAPIPGFGYEDCQPVDDDDLELPVRWPQPLDSLMGRTVAFEFTWTNGRVFGFNIHP